MRRATREASRRRFRVGAAAKALFVAVVFFLVETDGGPAAAAHRAPPTALETAAIRRLLPGTKDPFVDVAVEIVDPERRRVILTTADSDDDDAWAYTPEMQAAIEEGLRDGDEGRVYKMSLSDIERFATTNQ